MQINAIHWISPRLFGVVIMVSYADVMSNLSVEPCAYVRTHVGSVELTKRRLEPGCGSWAEFTAFSRMWGFAACFWDGQN